MSSRPCSCVAGGTAVPPDEIALDSRLIDDLGADSLDFVDIIFMLDRELDIRVRETELNFVTRLDFSSPEVMKNGFLTREVVDRIATWVPAMAAIDDKDKVTPRVLFSTITIGPLCIVAERRLAEGEARRRRRRGLTRTGRRREGEAPPQNRAVIGVFVGEVLVVDLPTTRRSGSVSLAAVSRSL
ncbi:MAG: acyl carrier protein [Byssovorax sp.]